MDSAPEGFLRAGDDDPFEGVDPATIHFGWIDGYRIVYEGEGDSWSAFSLDVPGIVAAGESREEVERLFREALPGHLALPDDPRAPRSAGAVRKAK